MSKKQSKRLGASFVRSKGKRGSGSPALKKEKGVHVQAALLAGGRPQLRQPVTGAATYRIVKGRLKKTT